MRIWHLMLSEQTHLVPGQIRLFATHYQAMGTKATDHHFVLSGRSDQKARSIYEALDIPPERLAFISGRVMPVARFIRRIDRGDLLVVHGAVGNVTWPALAACPRMWGCTVWVMWGGDVYSYQPRPAKGSPQATWKQRADFTSPVARTQWIVRALQSRAVHLLARRLRRHIVPRLGAVGALVPGDFDVLQSQCGPLNNYARVSYSSRPPVPIQVPKRGGPPGSPVRVLLGNSAAPSNRHLEALELLARYRDEEIEVLCPLSYPVNSYRDTVVEAGKRLLGDRFTPIMEMMPRDAWFELLKSLDILVFNQPRQQGLAALYTMLFAGRKCFLRSETSTYRMVSDFGIRVYPTESITSLSFAEFARPLDTETAEQNLRLCNAHLSVDAATGHWRALFTRMRDRVE